MSVRVVPPTVKFFDRAGRIENFCSGVSIRPSKERSGLLDVTPLWVYFCLLFFSLTLNISAQEEPVSIKVRKEQNLVKAYFDNVDLKLMAVDRFGNPKENKMLSYKLWIKGEKGSIDGYSNSLSPEMTSELKKLKKATKIFFTEIKVEDDQGHAVKLPDLYEVWFPNCTNCEGVGKKRR